MNETKVYLNTWGAYNNGCIGFGWMTPEQALEFMDDSLANDDFIAKYGEEFFIADIDNYLGVDFGNLDYANVEDVCNSIIELEDMQEWERDSVIALMEYSGYSVQDAIDNLDRYVFYGDEEEFYYSMDELIECELGAANDIVSRYFDYDSYHRDCMLDAYVASNGVVLVE